MITQKKDVPKGINWQKLAQELAEKGDLPGTSKIIKTVTQIKPEDKISAQELAALILRDYGLTKRVIQLANSCFYNPQGIEIVTISKAIIFLGFESIRKIALVTNFLEDVLRQTPPKRRKVVLSILSQAFFSAFLGGKLAPQFHKNKEEVFIHILFHRLQRILLAMHFPEEYVSLCQLEKEKPLAVKEKLYFLGEFLGKKWSFPRSLIDTLEGSPKSEEENHLASWVADIDAAALAIVRENNSRPLKSLLARLNLEETVAEELINFAYKATKEFYQPFSKYLTFRAEKVEETKASSSKSEEFFQRALAEITALLTSPENRYQEVLLMVLETIGRAFDCESVLFGLYNPQKGLVVRLAIGSQNGRLKGLVFPVGAVLSEIFQKKVEWAGKSSAIPEFQKLKLDLPADTDILFSPLVVLEKPLGMIMAFRKKPFSTEEAQKINILKNLAVMSITQAQKEAR